MANPNLTPYEGDFIAWPGVCGFIGEGGGGASIARYAHYAIQQNAWLRGRASG